MSTIPLSAVEAFLHAEARALDDRDWDTWLAFYAPDASFWMPAWDDNDRLKQFPAYLNRWDSQQARNEGVFAH